jgi:hypothetical protein
MIKLLDIVNEVIYGFNGPKSSYDDIKNLADKIDSKEKMLWSKGDTAQREWERISARYLPSGFTRDWSVLSEEDLKKALNDIEFLLKKYKADQ